MYVHALQRNIWHGHHPNKCKIKKTKNVHFWCIRFEDSLDTKVNRKYERI